MKKHTDILREYVRRLNDDDLKFLGARLTHRLGGDLGESLELIQRNQDIDKWLSSASSADDFFNMLDQVDSYIQQEMKKRLGLNTGSMKHEPKQKEKSR
jgi:hypothetical protein